MAYTEDDVRTFSDSVQKLLVIRRDVCIPLWAQSHFVYCLSICLNIALWPRFGIYKVPLV